MKYVFNCFVLALSFLVGSHTTWASITHITVDKLPIFEDRSRVNLHYDLPEDYQNMGISEIYKLDYPKVPLFHPYNPIDNERKEAGIIHCPLTAHFGSSMRKNLPKIIQEELNKRDVKNNALRIFLSAQNFPWKKEIKPCFRPHYAMEPSAPFTGGYWAIRKIKTGLFYSDNQKVCFEGHNVNTFSDYSISTHPGASKNPKDNIQGDTVLSGNKPIVTGLHPSVGQGLWSYVQYTEGNSKQAIVTLHWLLNDPQMQTLDKGLQPLKLADQQVLENIDTDVCQSLIFDLAETPEFKHKGAHIAKLKKLLGAN